MSLLDLKNLELVARVRANRKATTTEVVLAERLSEAVEEIDSIIKNFANYLVAKEGPVGAVEMATEAVEFHNKQQAGG